MIRLFTRLAQITGGIALIGLLLLLFQHNGGTMAAETSQQIGNFGALFLLTGVLMCAVFSMCAFFGSILYRDSVYFASSGFLLAASTIPILIGLLLPLFTCVREPAKIMFNRNLIKQLSLGMEAYHEVYGQFPPHKKSGHSWRVYLLPYLENDTLYQQIRLNEPWDSDWNRQFHNQMPTVFRSPLYSYDSGESGESGIERQSKTTFCLVVGGESPYPADGDGPVSPSIQNANGARRTIMIAESQPNCWMNPNFDIEFDEAIKGVNVSPRGIWTYTSNKSITVGLYDLSVLVLDPAEYSDLKEFHNWLTVGGGERDGSPD